jgi:hypothetical protein
MATSKHRITITLDDEDYEHLGRIAGKFGKSLSWAAAYAVKGLTREVGTGQFKVFRQWVLEQPRDPISILPREGGDDGG